MDVSIIIPVYNEEDTLPKLLKCLRNQTVSDFEVIVADADSKDNSAAIARDFGALVVEGGLPGVGRNAGAEAAQGDFYYFLDADVVVPENFVENVFDEMQERYIDLATCALKPLSDIRLDQVMHTILNTVIKTSIRANPMALGSAIFITSRLFHRIGGFDESIYVAEDAEFVKRASSLRPLEFLESSHVNVSIRRYTKEGRFSFAKKGLELTLHRIFKGEIRDRDTIEYDFDSFEKRGTEDPGFLDQLEALVLNIEDIYKKSPEIDLSEKWKKIKELLFPSNNC